MSCDLHIHTTASDGRLSPAEVARAAASAGLAFISITDHNILSGLSDAERELAGASARLIDGVELSALREGEEEIHILGYGFDRENETLRETCGEIRRRKTEQFWQIVSMLAAVGIDLDLSELPRGEAVYVGRPDLARLLVRDGFVRSIREAFVRFLGSGGAAYVPMEPMHPRRCIDAIHAAGGVAVLAHPTIRIIDLWIKSLKGMGLDGVETIRPFCSGNVQLYIEKAAEHFDLFVTGGSDLHGREDEPGVGVFRVPRTRLRSFFDALENRGLSGD